MLSDDVVAYSDSGWSKIGKLKGYNFLMTPITVDGDIYVFGGSGDMTSFQKQTEIWRVISILIVAALLTNFKQRDTSSLESFEVYDIGPTIESWWEPIVVVYQE